MPDPIFDRLAPLAPRQRKLVKGAFLFSPGDPVRALFLVASGLIELVRHQENGGFVVLQRAAAGSVLAEASIYAPAYHCDAVAAAPSQLLEIAKPELFEALRRDAALAQDWASYLAREVQAVRLRCEILSRKTVAERLDRWLAWNGGTLPAKGEWKAIAGDIGVSPEALYRELARRR